MSNDEIHIEPPDPVYVSIATGLLRIILTALGGVGFAWAAAVTGDQLTMIATALVVILMACWSATQKIKAHQKRKEAAVASAMRSATATAEAGQPVAIAVVDPKTGAI